MAEIVTGIKFKVIKLTLSDLREVAGDYAMGMCERCNKASFEGYYIAVLNRYYCPKCFNNWLRRATYYPEDKPFEDEFFNFWKTQLKNKELLNE